MKFRPIYILLVFIITISVYGCDGGGESGSGGGVPTGESLTPLIGEAKSENQFANPALQINADRDIYLTFLESPDSEEELNQTGENGFDEFPYVYEEAVNNTICWEDDDPGAAHSMSLLDNTGDKILGVLANGECVNQIVPAGIYKVRVYHDNIDGDILPLFFVPEFTQIASNNVSNTGNFLAVLKSLIYKLHITETSYAQAIPFEITTMIRTGSCVGCNPENMLLRGQYLSGADLEGANLMSAIIEAADFTNANLMGASVVSADMRNTDFAGANLSGADFSFSEIDNCTNFLDVDLTGAVWTNGCTCVSFECSNCGEIPMSAAPFVQVSDDCDRVQGPGSDDPGCPIMGPTDDPGDVPILSGS